jgi:hypothetical protein
MKMSSEYLMPYLNDRNIYSRKIIPAYNSDVDAAWEDVHSLGGAIGFLAGTGEHIHLVSDSAEDDPAKPGAGTGAHSIKVFYINTSGVLTSETIALDGAAAVISTATDVAFVLGAYVVDSGTGLQAAGQILIKNAAEAPKLEPTWGLTRFPPDTDSTSSGSTPQVASWPQGWFPSPISGY